MDNDNKLYDEIVKTLMLNVYSERQITRKIILWDFHDDNEMERLYFNVAAIVSDIEKENIYLDMPLHSYLKLKWKLRKGRKNLRWISWRAAKNVQPECKTSVYVLVDFVRSFFKVDEEFMAEINKEYYGWVK